MDNEKKLNIDNITSGIISYLKFIKNFKKQHEDEVISNKKNSNIFEYTFREFNLECYIIDKKYFDDFRSAINFDDIIQLLEPIENINEENKIKFKEELKKNLKKNDYKFELKNIKIYSELEEIKEVVKNFNSYTFVNKDLLCSITDISEINLKDKMMKVSKNKNDTCLISTSNNFILTINIKKIIDEPKNIIKAYKNLYYVEDITKRVFTLLYLFNEKVLQNKINNKIKNEYDFKTYYLINKEWLDEYKNFFMYDSIIKKLKNKLNIDNYIYKKAKYNLNDIVKKIGQIRLYSETIIDNNIRNAINLIPIIKRRKVAEKKDDKEEINQQVTDDSIEYFTPSNFCIINKDVFELLEKEEFFFNMDDSIKNTIRFDILIGSGKIIIKNKYIENKAEKFNEKLNFSNEYLFYVLNDLEKDETFILNYILYYFQKNELFFNHLNIINKENGFKEFTKNLDINNINSEQNIKDEKGNILGNFINFRIIEEDIKIQNNNKNDNINHNNGNNNVNNKKSNNNINNNINNNKVNNKNGNNNINNNVNSNKVSNDNNNMNNNNINNNNIIDNNSEINNNNNENNNIINNNIINNNNNYSNNLNNNNINNNEKLINDNSIININEAKKNINNIINMIKKIDILYSFADIKNEVNNEINVLMPEEIEINKGSRIEVLLIDEESLHNFKIFINYYIIYKYLLLKNEEKINYINEHIIEFYKLYLFYTNKINIPNNISLIQNFSDYKNNIENEKKSLIILHKTNFNKKLIRNNIKNEIIYYFKHKNESYLYFSEYQEILIMKERFNYWKLIEYNSNIFEIIKDIIVKNKKDNKIKEFIKLKDYKEFYLINNNWLNSKIDEKNQNNFILDSFKPDIIKTGFLYEYPTDFGYIEKEKEYIINKLLKKDININDNDIYIKTMFFIEEQYIIQTNHYHLGILDNNIIYFYLINEDKLEFKFLLEYENESIIQSEIKTQIIKEGILVYLYKMGIDFSKKGRQNLIDINIKKIGEFINFNNSIEKIDHVQYSRTLEKNEILIYNNIIQCLVNIGPFKDLFLNRNQLYKEKMIQENKKITNNFYKLMQYMWHWSYKDNNKDEDQNLNFMIQINTLYNDNNNNNIFNNNIVDDIKLLIEFILLSMHCESILDNNINYNIDELKKEFYNNGYSFIKDIFFFELICDSKCQCKQYFNSTNYLLHLDIEPNSKNLTIDNILKDSKTPLTCSICKSTFSSKIQFNSCPKILIIIIKQQIDNINFNYQEDLIIKDKITGDSKYKLISIIKNIEQKNEYETLCNISVDKNIWTQYIDTHYVKIEGNFFDKISEQKTNIPSLLIYQKIEINKMENI